MQLTASRRSLAFLTAATTLTLAATAPGVASAVASAVASTVASAPQTGRLVIVDVAELVVTDGDWEDVERRDGWYDPARIATHVSLAGADEVYLVSAAVDESWIMYSELVGRVRAGALVARVADGAPLAGALAVETGADRGPVTRVQFEVPAGALRDASVVDLAYARARHYDALLEAEQPGAAWFRLLRDRSADLVDSAALASSPHFAGPDRPATALLERFGDLRGSQAAVTRLQRRAEAQDVEAFGLVSGGRALAENLQLERVLPLTEPAAETVPLASIEGVTVPAVDFGPLLAGAEPALDPLARFLPDDRYAAFAPSVAALGDLLDELEAGGAPVLAALEAQSRDSLTRAFYERQLCAPLDGLARGLGSLAVGSVAITGSDPYLRTGTDLAVLLETGRPQLVASFLTARQDEALGAPEAPVRVTVTLGDREVTGVVSADRAISSYVVAGDGHVVVTNSLTLLGVLDAVARGERGALADSDEYRWFRDRYPLGAADEVGFAVVPDAAIRDWCSPRWRIATARRTRVQALLIDLSLAQGLGPTLADLGLESGALDGPRVVAGLGEVLPTPLGPVSARYGSAAFLTPIAELEFEHATEREAELYGLWRRGFEANWSNFFDPVGASVTRAGDGFALDLTVLPLIAGSDYRDLIESIGAEALEGRDGDPHAGAVVHFVSALDPEGDRIQEAGRELSGFTDAFGPNALAWLGDWWSVHADGSELLEELLEAEDLDDAWDMVEADLDRLPVVFEVGVARPLALAGFLTALRGMAESSAPGLVEWHTERTDDGRPFVRVASSALSGDELAIHYATTPRALIVSFDRAALVAALDRWNPPADESGERPPPPDDDAPTEWLGESVALEFAPRALFYLALFDGADPAAVARRASYSNLPILTEWRRRFPERDPVQVHRELFGELLTCPSGGEYVWDAAWERMASSVWGQPLAPLDPPRSATLPLALRAVERVRLGLTFEPAVDGLRARGELLRR